MAAQVIPYVANQVLRPSEQSDHAEPTVPTVLVCNNSLLRSGLQQILRGTPFAPAVTASAADPTLVQDLISEPALVLIEASQNTCDALEVVRNVRRQCPEARIVALADRFDLGFVRLGYQAGVDGFCSAPGTLEILIKSLELVMLGEAVLPSGVLRAIVNGSLQCLEQTPDDHRPRELKPSDLMDRKFSPREIQILNCLKEGAPNKAIARKLDITEATIKVHVKAILRKIGASNRTQAAMWASQRLPRRGVSGLNV
jgi:two-component system, NarL family, nitrate/nitrite response regulator NarL